MGKMRENENESKRGASNEVERREGERTNRQNR
jgi:hypothetical protein